MPSLIGFRINLKAASFFGERGERLVAYHFQAKAGFNIYRVSLPRCISAGNCTRRKAILNMIRSGRHVRTDMQSQGPMTNCLESVTVLFLRP